MEYSTLLTTGLAYDFRSKIEKERENITPTLVKIIEAGLKNITAGANPMVIKRGIEKATETVIAELKKISKPLKGKEEIAQVATISAADSEIGKMIAEALEKARQALLLGEKIGELEHITKSVKEAPTELSSGNVLKTLNSG